MAMQWRIRTDHVLQYICCVCLRDSSAELFCLQVSLAVLLLLFLFGSYSDTKSQGLKNSEVSYLFIV